MEGVESVSYTHLLDRYEGWPFLYRKETIKVKFGGKTVKAMVYIMNDGRPLGQPSCYYYSTILEGYKSAGFDVEILRKATTDSVAVSYTHLDVYKRQVYVQDILINCAILLLTAFWKHVLEKIRPHA